MDDKINERVQQAITQLQTHITTQIDVMNALARGDMVTIPEFDDPLQQADELRESWLLIVQQCNIAADARSLVASLSLLNQGAFVLRPQ